MEKGLNFVFICGRTCAGKDTQAELLIKTLGEKADRISTGDIYRGAKKNEGEYAKYHDTLTPYFELVDKGGLIPDEVMLPLVEDTIDRHAAERKSYFIFTGFPRTIGQLQMIDKMTEGEDVKYLYYGVGEETARRRSQERLLKDFLENPEKVRSEDSNIGFDKKLEEFNRKTLSMIKRLIRENRLINIKAEESIQAIEQQTLIQLGFENRRLNKEF